MAKNQKIKDALYKIMIENPELETNEIAKRFIGPLAEKRYVYRWIDQYKKFGIMKRKIGSNRPVNIAKKAM